MWPAAFQRARIEGWPVSGRPVFVLLGIVTGAFPHTVFGMRVVKIPRCLPMAVKLDRQQVAEQMQRLPEWTLQGDQIERQLTFQDFVDAMIFVNKLAEVAEELGHHPDIRIVYNRVNLALSTHDAGGLTQKDFQLAQRIDSLAK